MSSDIWTRCEGSSRLRPLAASPWRAVEAQHLFATRKLVDTAHEQALLEGLIEKHKPPVPEEPGFAGRHFLLTTSFRYPPLPHGSRFATRHERSLWYGSKTRRTAFSEVAYYRLYFLEGTTADLGTISVELSAFRCRVRARRGVDLGRPPFGAFRDRISSPTRYDDSQALGRSMREAGVQAFRYVSARDPDAGLNVALFTPEVFSVARPDPVESWLASANRDGVEFQRKDFFERSVMRFDRDVFLVGGRLPAPAP